MNTFNKRFLNYSTGLAWLDIYIQWHHDEINNLYKTPMFWNTSSNLLSKMLHLSGEMILKTEKYIFFFKKKYVYISVFSTGHLHLVYCTNYIFFLNDFTFFLFSFFSTYLPLIKKEKENGCNFSCLCPQFILLSCTEGWKYRIKRL